MPLCVPGRFWMLVGAQAHSWALLAAACGWSCAPGCSCAPGHFWALLGAADRSLSLLQASGTPGRSSALLGVHNCFWAFLRAHGCTCTLLDALGCLWAFRGAPGCSWLLLGARLARGRRGRARGDRWARGCGRMASAVFLKFL